MSGDRSVITMANVGAGRPGNRGSIRNRSRDFFSTMSRPALGPTQPVTVYRGGGGAFAGAKRSDHETSQSVPCSDKLKNAWIYTSSPP
jgi:hypothetical protein